MKSAVFAVAITIAVVSPISAQTPRPSTGRPVPAQPPMAGPGAMRGMVVDSESSAPISSASIAVRSAQDSSLVAGAIVRADGTFRIEGLRAGNYWARVTMLGYASRVIGPVSVTATAPLLTLGKVWLNREAIAVAGVVASAERSVVIAPDRNTYRARDVAPAATNASDVLENVPAVQVDADGKVSLRGNENVVVQINGRPTPIAGAQLAGYLKALPANTIERIEVIPNPSAKQDPEGMAGIINIVMKQGVDLGTSGGFTASASTANRYFGGANVGHQSGKLTYFVAYGFNRDDRNMNGINNRTRLGAVRVPLSFTNQDVNGWTYGNAHNLSANADYAFNKRDVLSTTLQLNGRNGDDGSTNLYNELNANRQTLATYSRVRESNTGNLLADLSLALKRTLTPQKHELSLETRFNRQDDRDDTDLWRAAIAAAGPRTDVETDRTDAGASQLIGQVDYTRSLAKIAKLETGYKATGRWLDRDFNVRKDFLGKGQFVDSDLSNSLKFSENVNGIYAVVSESRKHVDWQAGLRAEYANREFSLATTGATFPHHYSSIFPSGLLSFKLNEKSQAKLSYSRRIRRPGTQELNPFPVFLDPQNVFLGNPRLDPEYTDAFELGYQRSGQVGSLQFAPFYRRTSNVIRVEINTADTISNREVTSITFKNLNHSSSWGADLNGQFKLSSAVSGLASFNVFKVVTDGGSESNLSSNAVSWAGRVNMTFNANPATTIVASYNYRAPINIERGKFFGSSNANLTIRRKFSPSTLATLRFADPFNTNRFRVEVGDDNIIQLSQRAFNSRAAYLSVQYTFGQTPKLRQRRQDDQPQSNNPFGG